MNIVHCTLNNESIIFYKNGIFIQPILSDGFWFAGSPADLINIMVYHKDIDIDMVIFRVREYQGRY